MVKTMKEISTEAILLTEKEIFVIAAKTIAHWSNNAAQWKESLEQFELMNTIEAVIMKRVGRGGHFGADIGAAKKDAFKKYKAIEAKGLIKITDEAAVKMDGYGKAHDRGTYKHFALTAKGIAYAAQNGWLK